MTAHTPPPPLLREVRGMPLFILHRHAPIPRLFVAGPEAFARNCDGALLTSANADSTGSDEALRTLGVPARDIKQVLPSVPVPAPVRMPVPL